MRILTRLFHQTLIVFFANYLLPGVQIIDQTKIPHLGGDLLFAISLGLLNSLVYPMLRTGAQDVHVGRIAVITLILNFVAYGLLKFVPVIGVDLHSIESYVFVSGMVSVGSVILSYLEKKRYSSLHSAHGHSPSPHS
jgi:uncharacterized membrane protein YvlD (DUF360 family)